MRRSAPITVYDDDDDYDDYDGRGDCSVLLLYYHYLGPKLCRTYVAGDSAC